MSINTSQHGALASAALVAVLSTGMTAQSAFADILPNQPSVDFQFGGQSFQITRRSAGAMPDSFARPPVQCPPNCIEPALAAPGVASLTELEVFGFMQGQVSSGTGLLVDARLPQEHAAGSIPGAISVPAATLVPSNPYREDLLLALGATGTLGNMDFSNAFELLVFDDGPWSPVARGAIERLLEAGYPPSKLKYYRGGLQLWHVFGLTVSK